MINFFSNLLDWTERNDMQLNASKTKELILGPLAQHTLPLFKQQLALLKVLPRSNCLAFISSPPFVGQPTLTI